MKKNVLFLFIIGFLAIFGISSVRAFGNRQITLTTTVDNWSSDYALTFTCGSGPIDGATNASLEPTVNIRNSSGTVATGISCSSTIDISALTGITAGDTIYIDEVFDFSSFITSGIGNVTYTLYPGMVGTASSESFNSDVEDYIFGDYNVDDVDVVAVRVNELDSEDAPTGRSVINEIYLDGESEKINTKDMGTVRVPNFCVDYYMLVKGNLADPSGTFTLQNNLFGTVTKTTKTHYRICENNGVSLSYDDLEDYGPSNTQVSYSGVNNINDYEVGITDGGLALETGGTFVRKYDVTALLEAGSSPTGVFYALVPFILLVGIGVVVFIVFRKNKIKDINEVE